MSNEASVINDSSTRDKVPVLIEVRDAEDTGHEEINDCLDEDATDNHDLDEDCTCSCCVTNHNFDEDCCSCSCCRKHFGILKEKLFFEKLRGQRQMDDERKNEKKTKMKILDPKNTEMGFGLFD